MRNKFFLGILLKNSLRMLVPILILGALLYGLVGINLAGIIQRNNAFSLQQTVQISRLIFQTFDTANLLISSDTRTYMSLRRRLDSRLQSSSSDIEGINALTNSLNSIIALSPYIDSIYIFMDGADRFYSSASGVRAIGDAPDAAWIEDMQALEHESGFTSRRIHKQFDHGQNRDLISVYRRIFTLSGMVVVNIDLDNLQKDMAEYILYDGQLMLLSDGHSLLPLTEDALPAQDTAALLQTEDGSHIQLEGTTYLVNRQAMDRFNWSFLSLTPMNAASRVQANMVLVISLVVAGCLLGSILIAYRASKQSERNINALLAAFEYAERGEQMPLLGGRGVDEYNRVISGIIQNGIRGQATQMQLAEEKYQMKSLELMALRYQINPHFVSNTLKTIYWKSVENSGMESSLTQMIENFLDVVHYTLSVTPQGFTTLEEEIRHTQSFCDIITERHNGKCQVLWDTPPELLATPCLKLILQPYVENAFYHGIHSAKSIQRIRLRFRREGEALSVRITNTGIGMAPGTLARVRASLEEEKIPRQHIGLYNPHRRIRITYGPAWGIRIASKPSWGTCVLMRFPLEIPSAGER